MHILKRGYSLFCASVLLITMSKLLNIKFLKFRMFPIFLNINSSSYLFWTVARQNSVKYSYRSWYFKKYGDSRFKESVCLHYGLCPPFNQTIILSLKFITLHHPWMVFACSVTQCTFIIWYFYGFIFIKI